LSGVLDLRRIYRLDIPGAKEQRGALNRLGEETAQVGKKLPFPISYNVGQYSFYNSIQKEKNADP